MERLLRECSPHHNPCGWFFVNCLILLWSVILLVVIIYDVSSNSDTEDEITNVEFNYLIYNFGTSAVWLIETAFNILDYKGCFGSSGEEDNETSLLLRPGEKSEKTRAQAMALWIEVALAVCFFIDSCAVAFHLSRRQIHRQAQGMTIDLCLNMASYGYQVSRNVARLCRSRRNNNTRAEGAAERRSDASPSSEGLA